MTSCERPYGAGFPIPVTGNRFRAFLLSGAMLLLGACAVTPEPFSMLERKDRVESDKAMMFKDIEPVSGPISLQEAMARAIKYNLDRRVELLNEAVTNSQLELAHYDMLPKLAASAGLTNRSNELASSSLSYERRVQSLEPSVSTEQRLYSAQMQMSWNVLDFGVSYIRAKQMADRSLMADEQRRKVVQNIIQDVRFAYWRAVAAERLLRRLESLTKRTEAALADARRSESRQVRAPIEDLQYQRALLTTVERLKELRRDLVSAKVQLGALMNLPPGTGFTLVMPKSDADIAIPQIKAKPDELEDVALLNRPELLQASYQSRISTAETRRIYLEMLPGINLSLGGNYDSNKYAIHNTWASYGVNVAWNLLTLASTPARLDVAEADRKLLEMKRAALSMAVLAQVDVGILRYDQAVDEYKTAKDQSHVEDRIFSQLRAAGLAQQVGELTVIQAEADNVFATLRHDIAYANLQNAYGALLVAVGADPMPEVVSDFALPVLASAIHETQKAWMDGSALNKVLATLQTPRHEPSGEVASPPPAPLTPAAAALSQATPDAPKTVIPPVQGVPPAQVLRPIAQLPPPEQAAPATRYRALLGTYASQSLAQKGWTEIARNQQSLLPAPTPVLAADVRRSDGKPFVIMHTAPFADAAAAERFCDAAHQHRLDCKVVASAAGNG